MDRTIGVWGAAAAVRATEQAIARLRPIGAEHATITGGFWADRLRTNRERTLPHGFEQLQAAGNLNNLRLAAGADGRYRTLGQAIGLDFPFLDTDVYKWLEAVGWELGRAPDPALAAAADEAIALIEGAQRADGYLNTFVQVVAPGREYQDLAWGHELYCVGHLIQAAIAWQRALGDERLLAVAVRAADSIFRALGLDGREGIDGHPEIEMALVELYRSTAERRYLELAARMIDRRGHGLLGQGRFGPAYWQDHEPVGQAASVAGHAVRQLYLDCGAVDVATELGDAGLLDAVHRRWRDMVATRTYLTGGVGSRHLDEAFGDPFELPPDRAYAETCGAIASVMLAWRLLLATGDPECADVIERAIYNGVLPGVSLDGTRFFYDNPLQRRTVRAAAAAGRGERAAWFPCACCPPNLMRMLGSWDQYLATTDEDGIQVHQYAAAEIGAETGGGPIRIAMHTDYPWNGRVAVEVLEAPEAPWSLSLRVPAWAPGSTVRDVEGEALTVAAGRYWSSGPRAWRTGDTVTLDLDIRSRLTTADSRIDAVRGCVALERGPLVYCIETADLPAAVMLEEVRLEHATVPSPVARPDVDATIVGLSVPAVRRRFDGTTWPYDDPARLEPAIEDAGDGAGDTAIEVQAIPYFAWANRSVEAMRVWIPLHAERAGAAVSRRR
ncbi:MAG TPA: beta-L-arabinofuranosidase domain-containing protein [Candidatus Limnocylindrales bacterium]|nr:beta-L-arabinofuranosidase domain-containing protein [Candidatus Limnocylindrales bacterium]